MSEKDFVGKGFYGVAERYGEWNRKRFHSITEKVCGVDKGFCNGTEHVLQWGGRVFCNKIEKVLQWNGRYQKWVCNEMEMVSLVLWIK